MNFILITHDFVSFFTDVFIKPFSRFSNDNDVELWTEGYIVLKENLSKIPLPLQIGSEWTVIDKHWESSVVDTIYWKVVASGKVILGEKEFDALRAVCSKMFFHQDDSIKMLYWFLMPKNPGIIPYIYIAVPKERNIEGVISIPKKPNLSLGMYYMSDYDSIEKRWNSPFTMKNE